MSFAVKMVKPLAKHFQHLLRFLILFYEKFIVMNDAFHQNTELLNHYQETFLSQFRIQSQTTLHVYVRRNICLKIILSK